ncbi:hypothetical protein [Phenylobacterium kunshanense]|uniref:Uncharacterized protein n=1 Tax=Phenylobacterium kunshanense TaxID=1445034 RepID=A0A328BB01_9CAUL|nr:hypothetical protein [Phenylobacterium kunshanense]RAK62996.1 hypothetical protein DJ019_17115 [Phenylobacterium kunshanense]
MRGSVRLFLGLLAGMATLPALTLIGLFGLDLVGRVSLVTREDNPHLPMGPQGQAITAAGGSTVIWRGASTVTGQTCRGACDDLLFQNDTPVRVEIHGRDGGCVVCEAPALKARLSPWWNGPAAVEVQIADLKGARP